MIAGVEYEEELYAERLRRKTQDAGLAAGTTQWTDQLNDAVRVKLSLAWNDLIDHIAFQPYWNQLEEHIAHRTLRSIGVIVEPSDMPPGTSKATSAQLLSLLEVEHEALKEVSAQVSARICRSQPLIAP